MGVEVASANGADAAPHQGVRNSDVCEQLRLPSVSRRVRQLKVRERPLGRHAGTQRTRRGSGRGEVGAEVGRLLEARLRPLRVNRPQQSLQGVAASSRLRARASAQSRLVSQASLEAKETARPTAAARRP